MLYKLYFISILITAFSCTNKGSDRELPLTVSLWSDSLSINEKKEIILPSQGDDIIRITDVKHPSMDIYFEESNSPRPAVLIFPGGGYGLLAYDLEGTEVAEWLNSLGMTALVIKYTVPNDRESAFADGKRAIRIVRKNADKWNINPNKIGVLGFSAGGHLAARLSTSNKTSGYQKVDVIDNVSYRPDFSILVYPAYLNSNGKTDIAAEVMPSKETPPIFIVQTKDDSNFVSGTKIFTSTLDSMGLDFKFHLIEKGGHGYGLRSDSSLKISKWPDLAEKWLKEQFIIK